MVILPRLSSAIPGREGLWVTLELANLSLATGLLRGPLQVLTPTPPCLSRDGGFCSRSTRFSTADEEGDATAAIQ